MKKIMIFLFILLFTAACSSKPTQQGTATSKNSMQMTSEAENPAQAATPAPTATPTATPTVTPSKKIELEKRSILSDRIEILLPKNFTVMSEEMAKIKYPSERRPTLIYTNDETSVNIAFNLLTTKIKDSEITEFKAATKSNLDKAYSNANFLKDTIITNNNKNIGVLELITPALDTKVYNLMFFMELDGKLLLGSINCTEALMKEWQPIAQEILQSIKIK
jgi:hypothetical protein